MNIKSWREARFILVKDQLIALAARLGFMNAEQINEVPVAVVNDGWNVRVSATKGIGLQIRHSLEVEIWHSEPGEEHYRFSIDVLGSNQCKNCYFPAIYLEAEGVNSLSGPQFSDLCILPEIFGDFVAAEMLTHYKKD